MNTNENDALLKERQQQSLIKKAQRKQIGFLMTLIGANVPVVEALASPVIDQVKDKEHFTDLTIDMERSDASIRPALIKALVIKYLKPTEIMELTSSVDDLVGEHLHYLMNHEECRQKPDDIAEQMKGLLLNME